LKVVDLFCGCGGFGLGAELAGFTTVAGVDIDETLQSAYKLNFPRARVINGDLAKMDSNTWKLILQDCEVDGVIGGPPCQGYSRMGKRKKNDPRNELVHHYFRHVRILEPKFFVMENVEGLLDKAYKDAFLKDLHSMADLYTIIGPVVVDSSFYGAATKRKRVIVFGYKPEFFKTMDYSDVFLTREKNTSVTVKDAIIDIPEPINQTKDKHDLGWAKYKRIKKLSDYAVKMRMPPPDELGSIEAKEKFAKGMVSGMFVTVHKEEVKSRYQKLKPNEVDSVSRAKKLAWDGLCPTLRAGTGSDKGSYQAVRPIHPKSARVITVREAARLQGFPDWFCFHPTKWHSFRMIGNSVSPLVAEVIMKNIKGCINFSNQSNSPIQKSSEF